MKQKRRRPFRRNRNLLVGIESLESRKLLALTSPDFIQLESLSSTYDASFFVTHASPVAPTLGTNGQSIYDFRSDATGDQSTQLSQADPNAPSRILVDPLSTYELSIPSSNFDSSSDYMVQAFDAIGTSLGWMRLYGEFYETSLGMSGYESNSSRTHWSAERHTILGPSGATLPVGTVAIEVGLTGSWRFGFLSDTSLTVASGASLDRFTSGERYPVDTSRTYNLSFNGIRDTPAGTPQLHSIGYVPLDVDGRVIDGAFVERYATAVDTTLAVALKPGDTKIFLTSAAGWSNTSSDPATRALAWYGYADSTGHIYPDYTYTRNVARDSLDGLWSAGGVSGNTITLAHPWTGPSLSVGASVRNAVNSDALVPALLDRAVLPASGTQAIAGTWTGGKRDTRSFPPGTAAIQLAALTNQTNLSTDERVRVQIRFGSPIGIQAPNSNTRMIDIDVLANDGLGNSPTVHITNVTPTLYGTASIMPGANGGRDKIRYVSSEYFIGTDLWTYTVTDSSTGATYQERVSVESRGGNLDQYPTLRSQITASVPRPLEQHSDYNTNVISGQRFVNDGVGTPAINANYGSFTQATYVSLVTGPRFGSISLHANGTFEYTSLSDFVGGDQFIVSISNGSDTKILVQKLTVNENAMVRDQKRLLSIGFAMANFESQYRQLFYAYGDSRDYDANNHPYLSWRVHLLPILGYQSLYSRFNLQEPWDSPNNLPLLGLMPDVFRSGDDCSCQTETRYQSIAGTTNPAPAQLFLNEANARLNRRSSSFITDPLESVLLVVQSGTNKAVPWTKPDDLDYDAANPVGVFGNVGPYFNAVFAGDVGSRFLTPSVRAVPSNLSGATYLSMMSIEEPINSSSVDVPTLSREWATRSDFPKPTISTDSTGQYLRTIGVALLSYESTYRRFPPATADASQRDSNGVPYLSWRVNLLPYLGYSALYSKFHFNEPWDSPNNLPLLDLMPEVFRSLGDSATSTTTRFRLLGGTKMGYPASLANLVGPRLQDFTDGTNSISFVEAGVDKGVPWTKPDVLVVDTNDIWGSIGSLPNGKLRFGLFDGSSNSVPTSLSASQLIALATTTGAELIDNESTLARAGQIRRPSRSTVRQLATSALNFESAFKVLPHDIKFPVPSGPSKLSWRVAILPYLGYSALYSQFHLDEAWDSPNNLALLPFMPDFYRIGSDPLDSTLTRIEMFAGANTVDPRGTGVKISTITDGTGNTLLFAATGKRNAVPWTAPADIAFDPTDGWDKLGISGAATWVSTVGGEVINLPRAIGDTQLARYVHINDGIVPSYTNVDFQGPLVIREGERLNSLDFNTSSTLFVDVDNPTLIQFNTQLAGYLSTDTVNRITVGTPDNQVVDARRQTKLNLRVRSNPFDPTSSLILLKSFDVIVLDNESYDIVATNSDPIVVDEAGRSADLFVRPNAPPNANVVVRATSLNTTEVSVSNSPLTFTPANWQTPQRVTVTGLADNLNDGNILSEVRLTIDPATLDSRFSIQVATIVNVLNLDDRPATAIRLANPLTTVLETKQSATFDIGPVIVDDDGIGINALSISGPDASKFSIVGNTLSFHGVLDADIQPNYSITIAADDSTVGTTPDISVSFQLNVTKTNTPPGLVLSNSVATLPEGIDASLGIWVASIGIIDDPVGVNALTLSGPDAALFQIANNELRFKSATPPDFETKSSYQVTVNVDDTTVGTTPDASKNFVLTITNVNEPAILQLTNTVTSIPEMTDTSMGVRVADIGLVDDALGSTTIGLSGPDNAYFQLVNHELRFRSSTLLDFETKSKYVVCISLDDPTIGNTPDATYTFTLSVSDVNEAPTGILLSQTVTTLPELTDTTSGKRVAKIAIVDDALGSNTLSVAGPDAAYFRILGNDLVLLTPAPLDFETKSLYQVSVVVDDPSVGNTPDATVSFSLAVTDVNELPTAILLANVVSSVPENTNVSAGIHVADLTVVDDALGTNLLSVGGPDAAAFRIVNRELQFILPTPPNFESRSTYNINLLADDPTLGTNVDVSLSFVFNVTDVNEAPFGLQLSSVVSVPELTDVSLGIRVANIAFSDDALGTNVLTLSGPDAAAFQIVDRELQFKLASPPNFEAKSSYRVTLNLDDSTVGSTPDASLDFVLSITDVNEPPDAHLTNIVSSIPEQTNASAGIHVADVVVVDDALGTNVLTLSGPDAASFVLVNGELKFKSPTPPDFETKSSYQVVVNVDDATVGSTPDVALSFVLSIADVNEAPTAILLSNPITSLPENTDVLTGLRVADIDVVDDALGVNALTLSGPDAAAFQIVNRELQLKVQPDFEAKSLYQVVVNVDDATVGNTPDASTTLTLRITDVNEPPTAIQLSNVVTSIPENSNTTSGVHVADFVVIDDALGSFSLSLSGPDASFFQIVNRELRFVSATPPDFESKSSYFVSIDADDPTVGATPDVSYSFTFHITDVNEAPTGLKFPNAIVGLPELTDTSLGVYVADIVPVDDALGTNVLSLSGPEAAFFQIVNRELRFKSAVAPNFEAKSSYQVNVSVDDKSIGGTPDATALYVLRILDVNEAPTSLQLSNTVTSIPENTDASTGIRVANLTIVDDALGVNTYTITGPDASSFRVVNGELQLFSATAPDFESKSTYRINVEVDDVTVGNSPDLSQPFVLNITDLNEAPRNLQFTNVVSSIPEMSDTFGGVTVADVVFQDDALGVNVLSLSGPDASLFQLVNRVLQFKSLAAPDFETKSSYQVDVNVDDATVGGTPDETARFVLLISDVNEAPTAIQLSNTIESIPEHTDTSAGIRVADITVVDDAIGTNGLSLTGPDADSFRIVDRQLQFKSLVPTDFKLKSFYLVMINVDDPSIGSTPDASAAFAFNITDANDPPTAIQLTNVVSRLPESANTSLGVTVADIVVIDDALGSNGLSLSGPDAASFEIVNGKLRLRVPKLDYETKPTYQVTVRVDDPTVGTTPDATVDFSIAITDVNEPPTLALANKVVSLLENTDTTGGIELASIVIIDDALGSNRLSLSGPDAANFEIANGKLRIKPTILNFETKATYRVSVAVDDPTVGLTPDATVDYTLNIEDVNEPPALQWNGTTTTLPENFDASSGVVVGTVVVTDDALGSNTILISGPDGSNFALVDGKLQFKAPKLDFETKPTYRVTVAVDDPTIGTTPEQSIDIELSISDINEPPTAVRIDRPLLAVAENTDVSAGIRVGNIVIDDDQLGVRNIAITGPDASLFESIGGELHFRTSIGLDFETKASYQITLVVSDPTLLGSTPVSTSFHLDILNTAEVLSVTKVDGSQLDGRSTDARIVFDGIVDVGPTAIAWNKSDVGGSPVLFDRTISTVSGKTVVDLKFQGPFVDSTGLIDGVYAIQVDGTQIHFLNSPLAGTSYGARFELPRPLPAVTVQIVAPRAVEIGAPTTVGLSLVGSNLPSSSSITYHVDLDGDGTIDRNVVGGLTASLSGITYLFGGGKTIHVTAENAGTTLADGWLPIDVVPYTTNGTRWTTALDVNADDSVSPLDVLVVINWLNANKSGNTYLLQLDVDRDGGVNPLDVLNLVNYINGRSGADTYSPFASIAMSDSGASDGLTSDLSIHGKLKDPSNQLFLSLDGVNKHDASQYLKSDGSFDITDQAIQALFGSIPDGDHVISSFAKSSSGFSIALDRHVTKQTALIGDFAIETAFVDGTNLRLRWSSAGPNVRYRIVAKPEGLDARVVVTHLGSLQSNVPLVPGRYRITVEAFTAAGNTKESSAVSVVIP